MGLAKRSGRGLSSMDGLIAATAIVHDLTIATRNVEDFEGFGMAYRHHRSTALR